MWSRIDAVSMDRDRLSFSAFEILCRLKDLEPQPVRSLASELVTVSPTRASRLIQDLIDVGHLTGGGANQEVASSISLISLTEEGALTSRPWRETFEESVKKSSSHPLLDHEDIGGTCAKSGGSWRKAAEASPEGHRALYQNGARGSCSEQAAAAALRARRIGVDGTRNVRPKRAAD